MNDISSKEKYNYVVALIVAALTFVAFKDELRNFTLSIGWIHTNLLVLLVIFAILIVLSAYLAALDNVKAGTRFQDSKLLNWIMPVADGVYFLGIILPIVVGLLWGISEVLTVLANSIQRIHIAPELLNILNTLAAATAGIATGYFARRYSQYKFDTGKTALILHIERSREESFENAERLYKQKFYGSSVIEAYKSVELALKQALAGRNEYRLERNASGIIEQATKIGLIDKLDRETIHNLRKTRNKVAHLDINLSKLEADKALRDAQKILEKINNDDRQ